MPIGLDEMRAINPHSHHSTAGLTKFPDVWQPADTVAHQEDGGYDEADLGVPHLPQVTSLCLTDPEYIHITDLSFRNE